MDEASKAYERITRETLEIIYDTLTDVGVNPDEFLQRCADGLKKYGVTNHLKQDYDNVQETIEEIQDAMVQYCFRIQRKEPLGEFKKAFNHMVKAYSILDKMRRSANGAISE